MADTYKTVLQQATAELTERRSRFIGILCPIESEAQANELLAATRKQHRDARHVTFAYSLDGGKIQRYSDDGEPQGTAGAPMMEVLKRQGLDNVLLMVVRYFGGILLGAGGLVRAYAGTAALAVQTAQVVEMRRCVLWQIRCDYAEYGYVRPLLESVGTLRDTVFEQDVTLLAALPPEAVSRVQEQLTEQSAGRLYGSVVGEISLPFTP